MSSCNHFFPRREHHDANLIAPEQSIALTVFEPVPEREELCDTVLTNIVDVLFGVVPGEWCARKEEAHDWV